MRQSPPATEDLVPACPHCGSGIDAQGAERGRAFRCATCDSWLYRGMWKEGAEAARCEECAAPVVGGCSCVLCGWNPGGPSWLRIGFLKSLLRRFRPQNTVRLVPVQRIRADGFQPRLSVELVRFESLRQSLSEMGMIQPLLLRDMGKNAKYTLISGHRRLLAARQLAWQEVPARVLSVSAEHAHALRTAENLHREELAPLDRAEAFERYFLLEGRRDRAELAAALGIAGAELRALMALLEAAPDARERIIYGVPACDAAPICNGAGSHAAASAHGPGGGEPSANGGVVECAALERALEALQREMGLQSVSDRE